MSTAADPGTPGKYVDFDEYVEYQLSRTRNSIKTVDVLTTLAGIGVLLIGYLFAFTLFDHWIVAGGFGAAARGGMLVGVIVASLALVAWKILIPWWRQVTALYAARLIEQSAPELRGSLLNLVDLKRAKGNRNPAIERALEKRSARQLADMDVDHAVDRRALLTLSYLLLILVTCCCVYALLSPKPISFLRPLTAADVPVATRTVIVEVTPGDQDVLARTPVPVRAVVRGRQPEQVWFQYSTDDGSFVDETLKMSPVADNPGTFELLFAGENGEGLTQTVHYRVLAGDARSDDYSLKVILAPSATVTQVDYAPAEYMQLEPRTQFTSAIEAWEGTLVTIHADSGFVPAKSAVLQLVEDKQLGRPHELPVQIEAGTKLSVTWKLGPLASGRFPTRYRIVCTGENGVVDPAPAEHVLNIRPDLPPEVAILDPSGDIERPANAIVPLLYKARDPDFRISFVTLRVERDGKPLLDVPLFEGKQQVVLDQYRWELQPLGLKAGDEVTFFVEARDNKHPSGNRRNSAAFKLRIVEPVAPAQAADDLQRQEERQADLLREERRNEAEQNPSGQDQQPQDGSGDKPADSGKDPREGNQEDKDPDDGAKGTGERPRQEPGDSEKEPQENDAPQPNNDGQETPRTDKPAKPEENPTGDENGAKSEEGTNDPGQQGLNPDGTDDAEALEKIRKHLQERNQRNPSRPEPGDPSQPPQPGSNEPNEPNGDAPEQTPGPEKGEQGTGQKPDTSDDPAKGSQPGETDNGKPSQNEDPAADANNTDADGNRKPSKTDDGAAEQRPGDPNTKGTGTPSEKPDPNATRTNDPNNLKREPGTSPTTSPSTEPRDPKAPREDANATDPRPGEADPQNPRKNNGLPNERPEGPDEPSRGPGQPDAQKSETPDFGEDGSSQKNSDGVPGDDGKGNSDPSTDPGQSESNPAGEKPGKPGSKSGEGTKPSDQPGKTNPNGKNESANDSTAKDSATPPNGDNANSSKNETPSSDPSGRSNENSNDPNSGKGNSGGEGETPNAGGNTPEHGPRQNGKGTGPASPNRPQERPSSPEAEGSAGPGEPGVGRPGSATDPRAEEQNLAHAREAADLVLRQLEGDLQRGDVDRDLLDQLGWTEDDVRRFSDRLRKQLQSREREGLSPEEAVKQRQFEEMLKNIDFRNRADVRKDASAPRENVQGFGSRNLTPPLEYREYIDAVTRELSRQKTSPK